MPKVKSSSKIIGLIIAAGFSSRMNKFKPLLTFEGKSFLSNIIQKLQTVCDEIIVVTGHNAELIENEITLLPDKEKIRIVFNANYNEGMFTSLQAGVKELPNCDRVLYHFVDQPAIPIEFYKEFVSKINPEWDWNQPVWKGKKGHPILFGKKVINLISEASPNTNLKDLTAQKNISKKYWECNYSQILNDIDTLERYKQLLKRN